MCATIGGQPASDGPGPAAAERFLGRVRARLVVSGLLAAAGVAALVNEALRWSSAAAVVYLGWRVPVFGSLGLLVLAALVPPTLRRWTPAAAAARADARLGLKDRLSSWVDFRARAQVSAELRLAQARETARALAGATPAAAVPIAAWRKGAPALLAVCVVYHHFLPVHPESDSPLLRVVVPARRLAGQGGGATPDGPAGGGAADAPAPADGERAKREAAAGGGRRDAAAPAVAGKQDASRPAPAAVEAETRLAGGDGRKAGGGAGPGPADGPGEPQQPERIESERVGTGIARVVDPLYRAGAAAAAAETPGGVATFHLLPQAPAGGTGSGPGGEAVDPEPVRVDFDALPAPYRPIVRAYFENLSRAAVPAGAGARDPEPARSQP